MVLSFDCPPGIWDLDDHLAHFFERASNVPRGSMPSKNGSHKQSKRNTRVVQFQIQSAIRAYPVIEMIISSIMLNHDFVVWMQTIGKGSRRWSEVISWISRNVVYALSRYQTSELDQMKGRAWPTWLWDFHDSSCCYLPHHHHKHHVSVSWKTLSHANTSLPTCPDNKRENTKIQQRLLPKELAPGRNQTDKQSVGRHYDETFPRTEEFFEGDTVKVTTSDSTVVAVISWSLPST